MRMSSAARGLGLLLGLKAVAALASAGYPTEMQAQIPLTYTPACSICHAGGSTDAGTATTDFSVTMQEFGLVGGDNLQSLDGALAGLEGENSPLIADLKQGLDPNNPNSGAVPPITYGCASAPGGGAGALGALSLSLLLFLRRNTGR
jgi:hypothetical protein